jgi:hypothetical protein
METKGEPQQAPLLLVKEGEDNRRRRRGVLRDEIEWRLECEGEASVHRQAHDRREDINEPKLQLSFSSHSKQIRSQRIEKKKWQRLTLEARNDFRFETVKMVWIRLRSRNIFEPLTY